jgi:peptidoglycan/xylan/chitin deacetylase (PgdA/CDA1 family)
LARPRGDRRSSKWLPSPRYLRILVRTLRFLGYKPTTISHALNASYGRFACLTIDGDPALARDALPSLLALGAPATFFVATRDLTRSPQGWAPVKELEASGWEIGSLGHELCDLTTCSSVEQRRLISRAYAQTLSHLGTAPKIFAYPFGAYDATTVSCVKEEGFDAAVTLRGGLNAESGEHEAHHLRRLPLTGLVVRDLLTVVRTALTRLPPLLAGPATVESKGRVRTGAAL